MLTYWSGIVDETDLCFLGGTPAGLMDVMGLRSTEIDALYDGESNVGVPCQGNHLHMTESYRCTNLCDLVKASTAEVLMTYGEDFYEGMPALTCNRFGKGRAYYICADFEQEFYNELFRKVTAEAGVKRAVTHIPCGVDITTRESGQAVYLIVQNFNRKPVEISLPV